MLVQEAGYGLAAAGVMLSVAQGAGVTGRAAWGWIADRFGNCRTLLIAMSAVMVVCCSVMSLITPAWPQWVSALLFALIYRRNGSYATSYGLLTLFAVAGLVFLLMTAASARRAAVN
jgi:nitrate/nitrite transporter NarK